MPVARQTIDLKAMIWPRAAPVPARRARPRMQWRRPDPRPCRCRSPHRLRCRPRKHPPRAGPAGGPIGHESPSHCQSAAAVPVPAATPGTRGRRPTRCRPAPVDQSRSRAADRIAQLAERRTAAPVPEAPAAPRWPWQHLLRYRCPTPQPTMRRMVDAGGRGRASTSAARLPHCRRPTPDAVPVPVAARWRSQLQRCQ